MFIPGEVVSAATFPGVIVHEAAHLFFCKLRKVPVLDVKFFQFSNPPGYVISEGSQDFTSTLLISMGPFFVNSILCMFFCFPAFLPVRIYDISDPVSYFMLWLGVSIGMHAFPSTQDAQCIFQHAKIAARNWNPLAILSFPLVGLIYLANLGSFVWLDLLYGVGLGLGLPELVFKYLMAN